MNPELTLSFPNMLWTIFVLVVSTGMLMLAYWILEKRLVPVWHAFFAIVGLFFIRVLIGSFMSLLPLSFLWWWLLTAVYFHFVLPGPLPTWETAVLALLQQLYTYLFGVAVLFLGVITSVHPRPVPPNPVIKPPPTYISHKASPLNPTAPVQNPASAVLRPPLATQPPPVPRSAIAVTLSGMARTLDSAANARSDVISPPYPTPNIPEPPAGPEVTLVVPKPEPPPVPAATLPVPTPQPMPAPAQTAVNTVIPESAVPPPAPPNEGIVIEPIAVPQGQ